MDRSHLDLTKLAPILVVGYGYMGKIYVGQLLKLGVPAPNVLVVDRLPERASASTVDYPGVQAYGYFASALELQPRTALVLTNTPDHLSVLMALVNVGVQNIFCEKPVVLPQQREDLSRLLDRFHGVFCVGYLINFSPALQRLREFIRTMNLQILKIDGRWGKDRTKDRRPSAGDLEDETTHPLHTALALISGTQDIKSVRVRADLLHLPFVDAAQQQLQRQRDASYPTQPNSCSDVVLHVSVSSREIPVLIRSSFVSFEQERRIDVTLGDNDGNPSCIARLEFDVNGEDRLLTRMPGSTVLNEVREPGKEKLGDQLSAFLTHAAGGERHPLLTDATIGGLMVEIASAAFRSHDSGCVQSIALK